MICRLPLRLAFLLALLMGWMGVHATIVFAQDNPEYQPREFNLEQYEQEANQPLQVFLEINIFEVIVTEDMNIGFVYDLLGEVGEFRGVNLSGDPTIESDLGVLDQGNESRLLPSGADVVARVYEGDSGDILTTIQALAEDQIVRVHANPILLTIDGETAELFAGDDIPFLNRVSLPNTESVETKFQNTGVELRVTPYVRFFESDVERTNPVIYVNVYASLKTVTRFREEEGFLQPIVDTREYRSPIWVMSGERILIGSIFRDTRFDQTRGVPLLMDVPVLGRFFRSSSVETIVSQLIIMIRPAVYDVWGETTDLSAQEQQSRNIREFLRRKSGELNPDDNPFEEFRDIFLDHSAPQR